MLWPPPTNRARVRLPCGCGGTVRFSLSVAFVCVVRIDVESLRYSRPHRLLSHRIVRLERLQAATEPGPSASQSGHHPFLGHTPTRGDPWRIGLPRDTACVPLPSTRRVESMVMASLHSTAYTLAR